MLSRCVWQSATWRAGHQLTQRTNCLQSRALRSQQSRDERLQSTLPTNTGTATNQAPGKHTGHGKRWQIVALSACIALGIAFSIFRGAADEGLKTIAQRHKFTPYELVWRQPVSSTLSIFHLRLSTPDNKSLALFHEAWQTGIWNVLFKQPQIQVVRAYTPLPPTLDDDSQDLRFLIRHDPHGEVSSWLHRLPVGSSIEMKGPNLELEIPPSTRNITFLAGGTGIAPALQATHALLSRASTSTQSNRYDGSASDLPSIHILWASRQREDCLGGVCDSSCPGTTSKPSLFRRLFSTATLPAKQDQLLSNNSKGLIVQELDALKSKYSQHVKVDYFVDEENTRISEDIIAKSVITTLSTRPNTSSLIIVSGPDGFISHFAGPKVWRSGREQQGPVGGVVAQALTRAKGKATSTSTSSSDHVVPIRVWKV
ncbi:hypothetical protein DV736_g1330, partial [Chaetothyriales sp. CBS 134916]